MATDNAQISFRRGVMSMVILALLDKEDMYGYQLVQETAYCSGGLLTTQEGSLYPVLYRLLDQGFISDRKVLVGRRMTRVYYHLEPQGKDQLRALIREYTDTTSGVFRIIGAHDFDLAKTESPTAPIFAAKIAAKTQEDEKTPQGKVFPEGGDQ